jgi:hypothetical protein
MGVGEEKIWIEKDGKELASIEPNVEDEGGDLVTTGGSIICRSWSGFPVVRIVGGGEHGSVEGNISVHEGGVSVLRAGSNRVSIYGGDPYMGEDGGKIELAGPGDSQSGSSTIVLNASSRNIVINRSNGIPMLEVGTVNGKASIIVNDNQGRSVFNFNSDIAALYIGNKNNEGDIIVKDNKANEVIHLSAGAGEKAKENARFIIRDVNNNAVFDFQSRNGVLYVGNKDNEGDIIVKDNMGNDSIHMSAGAGKKGKENSRIIVRDRKNNPVFDFNSNDSTLFIGNLENKIKGNIRLRDNTGKDSIHIDGGAGDITLGNADCAEEFYVSESESGCIEGGTVMIFDGNGKLKISDRPYDSRVAGVVSGAGLYKPGIILDRKKSKDKRVPITLLGKVYCKVDTKYSKINVGDLLTTSFTKGYAMKVSQPSKAFGAIIGKAMRAIRSGRGILPILISSR